MSLSPLFTSVGQAGVAVVGNHDLIVFESEAIAAAGDRLSPLQTNLTGKGASMYVHVDVTARVTCNLNVDIITIDPASGQTLAIGTTLLCNAVQLFTGFYAQSNALVGVPDNFYINVNHSDATAITYSVGCQIIA